MKLLAKTIQMLVCALLISGVARAGLTIDITQGIDSALPIAVVPFGWQGPAMNPPQDIAGIIASDLRRSGMFSPLDKNDMLSRPTDGSQINYRDWRLLGVPNLVVGRMTSVGDEYKIQFQLFDVNRGAQQVGFSFTAKKKDLRRIAHQISDIIFETITGQKGAFTTRMAYITTKVWRTNNVRYYSLWVADIDGHNAQLIVRSRDPLMSPSWSPDGRKLAYVSFEQRRPMIFMQDIFTAKRQKLSAFKGINGAPSWSPDGTRLAMSLSKDGNSELYVMHVASARLQRLTNHPAIDTEPTWSPDGQRIAFTSDRGGKPQVYEVSVRGDKPKRLTFEGRYNARPSYSPDGKQIAFINGHGNIFRVAVLELDTGIMQILTKSTLDESPSFAPNGSMIIYATEYLNRGVLAAVSVDGRVQQRIALDDDGDAREPAWGPFLTVN